jgi:hypothetical protein
MDATTSDRACRSAGVAELLWLLPGRAPGATGVVPLVLDGRPALALPWAQVETARAVAAAPQAALVLSDPRLTGSSWEPLAATGRFTLTEDGDGALFADRLLDQELRKHPPSRALADSPMLRREHWWYLPRLILLMDVTRIEPVARREGPVQAVLGVDDGGLRVSTVRVADWATDPLRLTGGPADAAGAATLVGQELSVPDVERWTVHTTTGYYADGALTDVLPAANRDLEPVPGLLGRIRRQRALKAGCIAALRAAGFD